jgi:hypothetical protein
MPVTAKPEYLSWPKSLQGWLWRRKNRETTSSKPPLLRKTGKGETDSRLEARAPQRSGPEDENAFL